MSSVALTDFEKSLTHAKHLLQGTKEGNGRPTLQETSMYVASVALIYSAWENFIEDIAVEVNKIFACAVGPEQVPKDCRKAIEAASSSTWELILSPGWSEIWQREVIKLARGSDGAKPSFGMNTASVKNVSSLFVLVGLNPWEGVSQEDKSGIDKLVRERGSVVHAVGRVDKFKKAVAKEHFDRVQRLATQIDESLKNQLNEIIGTAPW